MKDKKKLIAIIGGVLVVVAIAVLCVCLIPHNEPTPEVPGETIDKTDGNGPSVTPSTDPVLLKEFEELQEKLKDIYDVELKAPFVYDDGKYKYNIKDIVALYETFPSTKVPNKNTDGTSLVDKIFTMTNNFDNYNKLILEDTKPYIDNNGILTYPYRWDYFALDLPEYGYKEMEYPKSSWRYTMYKNEMDICLIAELFESEEMYYQACYDALMEFIKMVPENELENSFGTTVSLYSMDTVYKATAEKNYDVLFDGLINHQIVFVYKDEKGVFYRLESSSWDADYDGEMEEVFYITTSVKFDDETKFL